MGSVQTPGGLIITGIDEAGYGPMLGPLVVARATFAISDWRAGQPAPDLWELLSPAVCRKPADKRARVPIADSKQLKLANDTPRPLRHLLRGVLAMLAQTGARPRTERALLEALGAQPEDHPWYAGDDAPLDEQATDHAGIDASMLAGAMAGAGVQLLDLRAIVVGEDRFNALIDQAGNKAATTGHALAQHLGHVWRAHAGGHVPATTGGTGGPRVVCDRQGGRAQYGQALYDWLPDVKAAAQAGAGGQGAGVTMLEESPERSRYECSVPAGFQGGAVPRCLTALFQTEGERHHLPIALASMAAKLTREVLMARFNRAWGQRAREAGVELKPTAGYVQDARRWLRDAQGAGLITPDERRTLVRRA